MDKIQTTAKERPILFSGAMARALLAGTKTQTRRAVKLTHFMPKDEAAKYEAVFEGSEETGLDGFIRSNPWWLPPQSYEDCPYGQPGDRLWVREKFFPMRYDRDGFTPVLFADGFISNREYWGETYQGTKPPMGHAWKSPIHMPRWASRLLLEITAVRCERLQDISEADAVAEGVNVVEYHHDNPKYPHYEDYLDENRFESFAVDSYRTLWLKINGPDSWAANPWVWVVEFKRIEA